MANLKILETLINDIRKGEPIAQEVIAKAMSSGTREGFMAANQAIQHNMARSQQIADLGKATAEFAQKNSELKWGKTTSLLKIGTSSSVLVTAGALYGWNKYFADPVEKGEGLIKPVSQIVVGKQATEQLGGMVDNVASTGQSVTGKIAGVADGSQSIIPDCIQNMTSGQQQAYAGDGINNAMGGYSGPSYGGYAGMGMNVMNRLGNFGTNVINGNVPTSNIVGLIAAAWLMMSRMGLFGKLAGGLLGTMMIGRNSETQNLNYQAGNGMNMGVGMQQQQPVQQQQTQMQTQQNYMGYGV